MSRIIQCPACEKTLKLGEATAQKSVISCPSCSQKIRISPAESPAAPAPPARPRKQAPIQKAAPPRRESPARASKPSSSRPARRTTPARKRPVQQEPQYEDDLFAPMPSRSSNRKKSKRKSEGGSNLAGVAVLAGGVCVAMLVCAGAIWWVINTLTSDGVGSNVDQNIAQADNNDQGGSNPSAAGTPSSPSGNQPPGEFNSPNPVSPNPGGTAPSNPPNSSGMPGAAGMPVVRKGAPIRYGLKAGDVHVYTFELDAEIDGQTVSFPGSVTMTVANGRASRPDEVESGTGTGFLVSSDGYMLTCHHVVENATTIEAVISGRSYYGKVVATNKDQDLAIVKIDGRNLPTVALANSDQVQLAEDVRAIGYPLTDLLGQGLKVTRGTVSGINNRTDGKRFQIDANINPGNSGGPLFNGRGQVIAVNSAKLIAGSSISSVGFSVPINYAKQLLQQSGVQFQSKDGGPVMAGPALVQSVQPAVALLKVESRRQINQQYVLKYSGYYKDPTASSGSPFPRGMRFGPSRISGGTTSSRGRVVLDELGEIETFEDTAQLPFSTGSMAALMIHQMADDGAQAWSHENRFVLTKPKERNNGFPGFPGGFPMPPSPFGRRPTEEPDEVLTGGIETHRYRIISSNDKEIRIARDYELVTLDNPAQPMTKITGKGTIVFDRGYQMPKSMSYRQTYESNSESKRISIPIGISYQMQDPAIRKRQEEERAQAIAEQKAEKEAREAKEAAMAPEERLDYFLAEIKAGRGKEVYSKLAEMGVVESRRNEVCKLLEDCLKSSRPDGNQITALGQWATPRIVNVMILKLDNMSGSDWPAGQKLIPAIAKSGDEKAIKPIVRKLAERSHPWHAPAQKALALYGEKAEDAVLELLSVNPSSQAVEALKGVGTQKSLPVLKELANGKDFWIKKAAKEAITEIALRL